MQKIEVGLYLRISKDDGTSLAVDRQEAECRRKAEQLGWTITRVYTDQGRSASNKKTTRPQYDLMLADARSGVIDGVITWAHDRLTRQPEQLGSWLALADDGFKLATVAGELDLSSDSGRLAARIFVAVAEGEVRRKGARQTSANRQRAEQGKPYAKVRAFGYQRGGMVPEPAEAALICEAVAGLLAGTHSIHGIVNAWNRQGVLTTRNKPWTRTSLKRVLTSWRICGFLAYRDGKEVFPAAWPALVSREDVETLKAVFSSPGRNMTTKDSSVRNLLSHLIRCASCEQQGRASFLSGITQARGVRAYRCPVCFISIDRGHADRIVTETVAEILSDPGYQSSESATNVRTKRAELATVARTSERLSEMFASGEISLDQFRLMNAGPSAARKGLEAEISSLVERDALALLVDGLRLSEGFGNTVGSIAANAQVIRERFEALDLHQKRTVIRGLLPSMTLLRAASGGRQSSEAIRRRLVMSDPEEMMTA